MYIAVQSRTGKDILYYAFCLGLLYLADKEGIIPKLMLAHGNHWSP